MCGVRFMAETVKWLSPHKTVLLANPTAGCPMAEQMDKNLICPNMKATSLIDVYHAMSGVGGEEILLDDETIRKARLCIDKMIELG